MNENIINPNYLNYREQTAQNTKDIKKLQSWNLPTYYTSEELETTATTIFYDKTNMPQDLAESTKTAQGYLLSINGNLFKIVGAENWTLSLYYYTNVKGLKGDKGDKGDKGAQGVGFDFKGTWVANKTYYTNDVVTYDNNGTINSYIMISKLPNYVTSATPPADDNVYWQVFTSGGGGSAQNLHLYRHDIKYNFNTSTYYFECLITVYTDTNTQFKNLTTLGSYLNSSQNIRKQCACSGMITNTSSATNGSTQIKGIITGFDAITSNSTIVPYFYGFYFDDYIYRTFTSSSAQPIMTDKVMQVF